jgi:DNA-binding NarL/FixJ family response regulator
MGMAIRLMVVDGHTLTRYGFRELIGLEPDMEVVAECGLAVEAAGAVAAFEPDVVTIDVTLPDGDGLQLAKELRDSYSDLGIVILASREQDDVLFRALQIGVSAFVPKTAPLQELLSAVRHAAVAPSSFTSAGLALALSRRHAARTRLALSARESEVLELLHNGLSIPAIAMRMYISPSTAKTYVSRLYEKLGAANRAQALMIAFRTGLIQFDQDIPGRSGVVVPVDAVAVAVA